jgi:hypothetical protein
VGGRTMIAWAAVLGLVVSVQAARSDESLADKAARARKPAPSASPSAPAKVFTNDDLINARGNVIVLPAPEDEATPPDAGTAATAARPEPTEEEKRAQAGAALQKQIDEQAQTIKVAQAAIVDWEQELNDLTNYTFGTKRAAVMQSIDEARKVIADAQKSIVDLEDQARRQGVRVTLP